MARKTASKSRSKTASKPSSKAQPAAVQTSRARAPEAVPEAAPATAHDRASIATSQHIALKQCRHGWFMYNLNDSIVGMAIDRYGEWCEGELGLLAPLLRPGRVVIDVGAFIGTHTVFFAKQVGPAGHVYAIEPQRHTFHMLCGNVALNSLKNVTCLPCIAAAVPGEQKIAMYNPDLVQNFGGARVSLLPNGETVSAIRIDDLPLSRCDLIKIDTEGMEPDVLAGARKTIERFRPVVYCENNTIEKASVTIDAVAALGYSAWWHISSYYNPHNFFGNRENLFANYVPESNILCTPPGAKIVVEGLMPVEGRTDNWQKALQRMRAGPAVG
ncbi:MAG: FkbM family methyltransferase [Dongiaceae bacterium]